MYDKDQVAQLAQQLADRIAQIRPGYLFTSATGMSNQSGLQQELRRQVSDLMHGIHSGWERQAVNDQLGLIEGSLQNATAIGLLMDNDLQRYLGLIDDLHGILDQTK